MAANALDVVAGQRVSGVSRLEQAAARVVLDDLLVCDVLLAAQSGECVTDKLAGRRKAGKQTQTHSQIFEAASTHTQLKDSHTNTHLVDGAVDRALGEGTCSSATSGCRVSLRALPLQAASRPLLGVVCERVVESLDVDLHERVFAYAAHAVRCVAIAEEVLLGERDGREGDCRVLAAEEILVVRSNFCIRHAIEREESHSRLPLVADAAASAAAPAAARDRAHDTVYACYLRCLFCGDHIL